MDEAGDCYSNWWGAWNQAKSSQENAAGIIADYEAPTLPLGANVITALNNVHNAQCAIRTCLMKAINWNIDEGYLKGLLRRLSICWDDGPPEHWPPAGEEYELTWEKIVNVWLTAPEDGKLFTILAIDSLRKDIWEKPVTWQALAGEAGGL